MISLGNSSARGSSPTSSRRYLHAAWSGAVCLWTLWPETKPAAWRSRQDCMDRSWVLDQTAASPIYLYLWRAQPWAKGPKRAHFWQHPSTCSLSLSRICAVILSCVVRPRFHGSKSVACMSVQEKDPSSFYWKPRGFRLNWKTLKLFWWVTLNYKLLYIKTSSGQNISKADIPSLLFQVSKLLLNPKWPDGLLTKFRESLRVSPRNENNYFTGHGRHFVFLHMNRILKIRSHQERPERCFNFKNFSAKHTSLPLEWGLPFPQQLRLWALLL